MNLQKVLPLLLVLFFVIPVSNAFAYTGGFLDDNPNYAVYPATVDNNLNTYQSFSSTQTANIITNLGGLNITSVYAYVNILADVTFKFYDTTNKLIYTWPPENYQNKTWSNLNIENVDRITISNEKTISRSLYEFDFKVAVPPTIAEPVTNLQETHNYNSVNLRWTNPPRGDFTGVSIEKDGVEIATLSNNVNGYQVGALDSETTYVFQVFAKYSDGSTSEAETISVTTNVQPVDTSPPGNISNLLVTKTSETVNLIYVLPVDTDFSHLEIYRNSSLIDGNYKSDSYTDFGLVPNTSYVYKIVSVDLDGNKSSGFVQTVVTDTEVDSLPPEAPKGLNVTNATMGARVNWSRNTEPDMKGYNLYVDSVKYNSSEILSTNYTINGLSNDEEYSITVTAVDTSGNESLHSAPIIAKPSESEMPIFTSNFTLKDVADGTNNWFMSFWPVLAFSVSISLAFVIARRSKGLFFA